MAGVIGLYRFFTVAKNGATHMKKITQTLPYVFLAISVYFWGSAIGIHAKAQLAQRLIESTWEHTLLHGKPVKPWPWADTWPIARLAFPNRKIAFYVLAGADGSSLAFGPGLDLQSSQKNFIIHGHRDTHFALLEKLQPGEQVQLQLSSGDIKSFRIRRTEVVDATKQQLLIDKNEALLQLVTCYPFNAITTGGPLRYVVVATPIETTEALAKLTM